MKRSKLSRYPNTAIITVLSVALLSACGPAKVSVFEPQVDMTTAKLCKSIVNSLPGEVATQGRREVTGTKHLTAAWGDPAITLTCGVLKPDALQSDSAIMTVNGIDWFAEELTAGYRFTTVNTRMYIAIDVPREYSPEANALADLTDALQAVQRPAP